TAGGPVRDTRTLARAPLPAEPHFEREADQVGKAVDVELVHQPRLVHLDGARTDPEKCRDLAVVPAGQHVVEHFTLARGQPPEALREARVALASCTTRRARFARRT